MGFCHPFSGPLAYHSPGQAPARAGPLNPTLARSSTIRFRFRTSAVKYAWIAYRTRPMQRHRRHLSCPLVQSNQQFRECLPIHHRIQSSQKVTLRHCPLVDEAAEERLPPIRFYRRRLISPLLLLVAPIIPPNMGLSTPSMSGALTRALPAFPEGEPAAKHGSNPIQRNPTLALTGPDG